MDAGLVLWLDADYETSLFSSSLAEDRSIWHDRSGNGNHAIVNELGNTKLIPNFVAGRSVFDFRGAGKFIVPPIRTEVGGVAVFVVSRRDKMDADNGRWQRLISCWDGNTEKDNHAPSFCVIGPSNATSDAYETVVEEMHFPSSAIGSLAVGGSVFVGQQQSFYGQICEILVFDRNFQSQKAVEEIREYLAEKWEARLGCEDDGWLRIGHLEDAPEQTNDDFPLSDQQNSANWKRLAAFTDEFNGQEIDEQKWWPKNPTWDGRQPAFFSRDNVRVSDGLLQLTFRKSEVPQELKSRGYRGYSSASVVHKERIKYGYFELRAKPMRSCASSSFYFTTGFNAETATEIDVFELCGKGGNRERKFQTNVHIFHTPTEKEPKNSERYWIAPWDLADDFHVYGLNWQSDEITYFVDGVPVRRIKNTHWHQPMELIFDTEAMFSWLGIPNDEDLPSVYEIDYLRTWQLD